MALVSICIMDSDMGQIRISRLELWHLIMHMCTDFHPNRPPTGIPSGIANLMVDLLQATGRSDLNPGMKLFSPRFQQAAALVRRFLLATLIARAAQNSPQSRTPSPRPQTVARFQA
jgi:hypothetical protein